MGANGVLPRPQPSSTPTRPMPPMRQCSGSTKKGTRCRRTSRGVASPPNDSISTSSAETEPWQCYQHEGQAEIPRGFFALRQSRDEDGQEQRESEEWIDFADYIPPYLHPDTKRKLREEMQEFRPNDKKGSVYLLKIQDLGVEDSSPSDILFKVGRTSKDINKRERYWNNECKNKEYIPLGHYPGRLDLGQIKADVRGVLCFRLEKLIHLELADLAVLRPDLQPGWEAFTKGKGNGQAYADAHPEYFSGSEDKKEVGNNATASVSDSVIPEPYVHSLRSPTYRPSSKSKSAKPKTFVNFPPESPSLLAKSSSLAQIEKDYLAAYDSEDESYFASRTSRGPVKALNGKSPLAKLSSPAQGEQDLSSPSSDSEYESCLDWPTSPKSPSPPAKLWSPAQSKQGPYPASVSVIRSSSDSEYESCSDWPRFETPITQTAVRIKDAKSPPKSPSPPVKSSLPDPSETDPFLPSISIGSRSHSPTFEASVKAAGIAKLPASYQGVFIATGIGNGGGYGLPCTCGTRHKEIFKFSRVPKVPEGAKRGEDENARSNVDDYEKDFKEWEGIVKKIIKEWGEFVANYTVKPASTVKEST
ncbi:hypothetical protein GYMLUDRAFT_589160 [Collybiopsis luxurians FD-317 M1]|uniref:Bacteriophage T5 Orf172 DNA-binding domain-containing protein n=1 Tax=Collybiopsis luxurians FD-317 M1 TaxID=944289 RepID=A0A0D0BBL2_9AGAR|nr:hypothetical protein GYMLUDRAFT_589160 [Collybiopsis luxurians FD-317 M1]